MNADLVAVNLLAHAHHNPTSAIAGARDGILTDMRKQAGAKSALTDRAAIDDAIPSPSVALFLPDRYMPDAAFSYRLRGRCNDRAPAPTSPAHAHEAAQAETQRHLAVIERQSRHAPSG
jgi:hypothetical protein